MYTKPASPNVLSRDKVLFCPPNREFESLFQDNKLQLKEWSDLLTKPLGLKLNKAEKIQLLRSRRPSSFQNIRQSVLPYRSLARKKMEFMYLSMQIKSVFCMKT